MALSLDEVRRIAALARLALTPEEERTFATQLSAVLAYVEQIKSLDVSAVEPMTHAQVGEAMDAPLREDAVVPGLSPEKALANAPSKDGTLFRVPRIIE